ncbi:MAG: glucose-6-phosphate isomerase, partial [Alphaproteobacteria bacterium]|nr:glucose-6-phosphate isomerase [Alphaproteobacteria bacterium]
MLTKSSAWAALADERTALQDKTMRDMPATQRVIKHDGIVLDYSRHRVTDATMAKLMDLAKHCDVAGWRDRMFAGEKINNTENRAVLHTALRRPRADHVAVDGENVMPFVHDVLDRMENFTQAVHEGRWRGHSGRAVTDVVNIGIGGSDLGPRMVYQALRAFHKDDIRVHFVSNVDGADIESVLSECDPGTTLFLIASKTFTTSETMTNARTARQWLLDGMFGDEEAVASHFVALSTNTDAVAAFGITPDNTFPFREWVGGRYSLWSAIGLPIALGVGFGNFRALLHGANAMDRHFCDAPLAENMPVVMGLLGLWYRNFWDAQSCAVIPYSRDMGLLPQWLQQTDMESNGKAVTRDGVAVDYETGPIVFGAPGTDSQHAFFQLIHQGTTLIPCDFIAPIAAPSVHTDHHRILLANMVAQAEALKNGRSLADSDNNPQKEFTGNRPSSLILMDRLDPYHLGQLIALYEHKVFVQGILWNINSFDQWGVELG